MAKAEGGGLNAVFNGMANSLAKDERVEICGLCSMFIEQYERYTGRNPRTCEKQP